MAIIYSYPLIGELATGDTIAISDTSNGNKTKSVTIGQLDTYINTGQATIIQVDDRVVTGASFNTNDGLLTLTRNGGEIPSVTTNLDGRYALTTSLATVATSGSYTDLSNQPTIPTNNNQLTNGANYTSNLGIVQSLTTNNSSGAATLENGVLNIPQYSGGGGGGGVTSVATTAPITGGPITSAGTIGITQASTSTDGYLISTDWNTFNNKQSTSQKGQASGYAPLDGNNKVPAVHLPDSLVGAVVYQGAWDALNNNPPLPAPASGNNGHYYIVDTAGTYLGITYAIGDWAISNGITWEKVDNTQDVNSVFGRTGNIVANATDYASFYDANVQSNWSETDNQNDAFILNKPTTITQAQANEIAANTLKTSFPGFGTTAGTALEGNTVIPAAYTDSDVDAHLNKTAQTQDNYVLSLSGNAYTWVAQSGGGGGTNLNATHTATNVIVTSDTGTNAQINGATNQFAGIMTAADKTTLDNLSSGNVTSIIAGTGIGINQSTGDVTITNTGSPTGGYTTLTRTFSGNELVNAFNGIAGDEIVLVTVPAGYQGVITGDLIMYVNYSTGTTNYAGSNLALRVNSIRGTSYVVLGSTPFTNSSFPFQITNGSLNLNNSLDTTNLGQNITLVSNSTSTRANFTAGDRDVTISFTYRLININL